MPYENGTSGVIFLFFRLCYYSEVIVWNNHEPLLFIVRA
ncbi:hypothetical protein CW298_2487 [Salmonella enterica subsp. enterica serovar Muenchen]|nr:hypothetical protein CW298_2487 [Salmonella enterica subsp. enterica serovar Muenchen]